MGASLTCSLMSDEVQRALGRIEGKLDSVLEKQESHSDRLDNHGNRLGKLERWQSYTLGAGAAAGVLVGALWTILSAIHGR
jgi:hypothetical protein